MGWLFTESAFDRIMKAKATTLARIDAAFGGSWWREVVRDTSPGPDRDEALLRGYLTRLTDGLGWSWWFVGVSDEWEGNTVYFLVFLTKSPHGVWAFLEALSHGLERHYDFTHRGQLDLEPLEAREARWVRETKGSILRLLETRGAFRARAEIDEVFGSALGLARRKHLRAAVKELYAEGLTSTDGVTRGARGDPELEDQWIRPP